MNWNALEWDRAAEELTWERVSVIGSTHLPTLSFVIIVNEPKRVPLFFPCRCSAWMAHWCFWWAFRMNRHRVSLVCIPVKAADAKPLVLLSCLQEHVFWVVSLNTLFILVFGESTKASHAAITLINKQEIKISGKDSMGFFQLLSFVV